MHKINMRKSYVNRDKSQNPNYPAPLFKFSPKNMEAVAGIIKKYPNNRQQSAVMPLLYLAQEQNNGWLSQEAMNHVAEILEMAPIKVYEVANFYTMYNKRPIGKYLLQICRTTPCWLCGSDEIEKACKDFLQVGFGQTTVDRFFTLLEVECLGACVKGPVLQVNDYYHENMTYQSTIDLLTKLREKR